MATRPPVYGQMSEFLSETESYVERAKIFFAANEIPDDKQPAVFLSVIGGKTYTLLRSLLSLDLPQDQTLEDIVAALESHFDPKPIVIAERFHFHRRNLEEVLRRLEQHGLRVKKPKCEFLQPSVDYLGHCIDAQGLHTMSSKLEAIVQAPEPGNLQQLRSFLGLLNYYGRFIPNLASK